MLTNSNRYLNSNMSAPRQFTESTRWDVLSKRHAPSIRFPIRSRITYSPVTDVAIAGGISRQVIGGLKSKGNTDSFALVLFS